MTAIWQPGSSLSDAVSASDGREFSQYLPLAHPTPTPFPSRSRVAEYAQKPPNPNTVFEATKPVPWIRPWFNDPSRLIWDEDNQFWRGYSITSSTAELNGTTNSTWMEIVTPDLTNFINNRIPFYLEGFDYPSLWGGCPIIDTHNAAGFGAGAVLYFISMPGINGQTTPFQCISRWVAPRLGLAPVFDRIVLENPGPGDIVHAPGYDFRDPRVDWDDARSRFVMKLTIGRGIAFYGSTDGADWQFLSLIDLSDWQQIETPDLVPMASPDGSEKWLLMFSIKQWQGKSASSVAYLTGAWDGTKFTPDFKTPKRLNWGADYYAQALTQHDGETYCWGWMGCWLYPELPTQGFGGNHSLITRLSLADDADGTLGLQMSFMPRQAQAYQTYEEGGSSMLVSAGTPSWRPTTANPGVSWRLDLQLLRDSPNPWSDEIRLDFCTGRQNNTRLSLNPGAGTFSMDRTKSGLTPLNQSSDTEQAAWNAPQTGPLPQAALYQITLIFDVSTVEVIINGQSYLSSLVFPPEDAFGITLSSVGNGAFRILYSKLSY